MKSSRTKELAAALYALAEERGEKDAASIAKEFAAYLKRKRMLASADSIIREYRKIENKERGIVEATITLTSRLPEKTRIGIREALKKRYAAKEVHILEKVDHRLIGGLKIRVGDEVIDTSVQGSLKQLQAQLLK